MTKSNVLILGTDPEKLLQQRQSGYSRGVEDVTQAVQTLVTKIAQQPSPNGLTPDPAFKQKLATKEALKQFFEPAEHTTYTGPSGIPTPQPNHNHAYVDQGRLVSAYQAVPLTPDQAPPAGYAFNHPFDYWWRPDQAYLPLRTTPAPYHSTTQLSDMPRYFLDCPCTNTAALSDVDFSTIRQARRATTDDLLAKAKAHLAHAGLDASCNWHPRYSTDWGEISQNPAYFEQAQPKLLHDKMPEHAARIDFLLLAEADLRLYSDWAALPVANVLTHDGYFTSEIFASGNAADNAAFFQITQTDKQFLMHLRDVIRAAKPDTLMTVFRAHE